MKIINSLKIEYKICKGQNVFKLSILTILFFSIFFGFIFHFFSNNPIISKFLVLMKGYKNGFNFSSSLVLSVYKIMIFFIIIISSTAICNEIQTGTLKTILLTKVKRKEIIIRKSLFLLVFFFLLFSLVFLLSFAIGGLLYGLGDISEKNYIIHSSSSLIVNYFISLFLMVFPIFALINFCIFFSVLFNNNIIAIISTFGLNFILYIFVQLELLKGMFLVNYLSLPIEIFNKMSQGLPLIWNPDVWCMILVTTIYSFIFLLLTIKFFKRKEVL